MSAVAMAFDPIRSRNRAAGLSLIALAVFVPALVLPRSEGDLTVRKLILFGSMSVMLISTVWFLVRWDESKRFIRLRAGQGILARWTIDAPRWEWFRGHSKEWDKADGVKPNDVDFVQALGGKRRSTSLWERTPFLSASDSTHSRRRCGSPRVPTGWSSMTSFRSRAVRRCTSCFDCRWNPAKNNSPPRSAKATRVRPVRVCWWDAVR